MVYIQINSIYKAEQQFYINNNKKENLETVKVLELDFTEDLFRVDPLSCYAPENFNNFVFRNH